MIEAHPMFDTPEDDVVLWRYMDLSQLVSLLSRKTLHFTRLDRLNDPFEGSWPRATVMARMEVFLKFVGHDHPKKRGDKLFEELSRNMRRRICVSCWHSNQTESAAMWSLYLKSDEGIAIRTTVDRIRRAFAECPESVYLGKIQYVDFDNAIVNASNMLTPATLKRVSFAHEQEVRLVHHAGQGTHPLDSDEPPFAHGVDLKVSLDELIEAVVVAHATDEWLFDVINDVCLRYGMSLDVKRSSLDEEPAY